jgi:hypothetical protein
MGKKLNKIMQLLYWALFIAQLFHMSFHWYFIYLQYQMEFPRLLVLVLLQLWMA